MRCFKFSSLFGLLVALLSVPAQAGLVTLGPVQDSRVRLANPNLQDGDTDVRLSVYTISGNVQRSLLEFDLSSIAAGQQIDSAILTLYADRDSGGNGGGLAMNVHAVDSAWLESQVSWNQASTGDPWSSAGGDFDSTIYATSSANPAHGEAITWDITTLAQNWYDGSIDNFGLLLRSFQGNRLHFNSSNFANASLHPTLAVTYSAVPEPSSLMLFGIGLVGFVGVARRRRRVSAL